MHAATTLAHSVWTRHVPQELVSVDAVFLDVPLHHARMPPVVQAQPKPVCSATIAHTSVRLLILNFYPAPVKAPSAVTLASHPFASGPRESHPCPPYVCLPSSASAKGGNKRKVSGMAVTPSAQPTKLGKHTLGGSIDTQPLTHIDPLYQVYLYTIQLGLASTLSQHLSSPFLLLCGTSCYSKTKTFLVQPRTTHPPLKR